MSANNDLNKDKRTITITFGDVAENHVGNQQIKAEGSAPITAGFTREQMEGIRDAFNKVYDTKAVIHTLNDNDQQEYASIIHIPNAISAMEIDPDELMKEQFAFAWDSQYYDTRRKMVCNKIARHNICYARESQTPDYENKKGTVVAWDNAPLLKIVRNIIISVIGNQYKDIVAEGNLYYDKNKCGIGFHGDAERYIVIAIRLGATIPLVYQWYQYNNKQGVPKVFNDIKHGDMYMMSAKAVGRDWKLKNTRTLRHAAGCKKYTNI